MVKKPRTYRISKRNRDFLTEVKDKDMDKTEIVNRALKMYRDVVWDPDKQVTDKVLEEKIPEKERR